MDHEVEVLPNGLRVVVQPDPGAGLVATSLTYACGAADDPVGLEGMAHLVEHLSFLVGGGPGRPPIDRRMRASSLSYNAVTRLHETEYLAVLPSKSLDAILDIEAERLRDAGRGLTDEAFSRERDVVLNERRQRLADRPSSDVWRRAMAQIYPPAHPYAREAIGSEESIRRATPDDARAFWQRCYVPSNATLVVAGDVTPARARAAVRERFGGLPPGEWSRVDPPGPLEPTGKRSRIEAPIRAARVYVAWRMEAPFGPNHLSQQLLASVLAGWLWAKLVDTEEVATETSVSLLEHRTHSLLVVEVTLRRPELADEAEAALMERAGVVQDFLGDASLRWRREQAFTSRLFSLESPLSRARSLATYAGAGQAPSRLRDDVFAIRDIPHQAVRELASRTLTPDRSFVVLARPTKKTEGDASPESARPLPHEAEDREATDEDAVLDSVPEVDPRARALGSGLADTQAFQLRNGLRVFVLRTGTMPIVTIRMMFASGYADDPVARHGLGNLAMEAVGTRGSFWGRTDLLNLTKIGAKQDWGRDADATSVSARVPSWYLGPSLDLFARKAYSPFLSRASYEAVVKDGRRRLNRTRGDADVQAWRALQARIYGKGHPYGWGGVAPRASLDRASWSEAKNWIERNFVPGNAWLIVTGDVQPESARSMIEEAFESWEPGPVPERHEIPAAGGDARTVLVPIEKLSQATLQIGYPTPPGVGDEVAIDLLRAILERRAARLREGLGVTYGVAVGLRTRRGPGILSLNSAVDVERIGPAVRHLLAAIESVRTGDHMQHALEVARRTAVRWMVNGALTSDRAANLLQVRARFGLAPDHSQVAFERVLSATPAEIHEVAVRILDPARRVIVVAGPRKPCEEALAAEGLAPIDFEKPH